MIDLHPTIATGSVESGGSQAIALSRTKPTRLPLPAAIAITEPRQLRSLTGKATSWFAVLPWTLLTRRPPVGGLFDIVETQICRVVTAARRAVREDACYVVALAKSAEKTMAYAFGLLPLRYLLRSFQAAVISAGRRMRPWQIGWSRAGSQETVQAEPAAAGSRKAQFLRVIRGRSPYTTTKSELVRASPPDSTANSVCAAAPTPSAS
jgi:hypothetical protein